MFYGDGEDLMEFDPLVKIEKTMEYSITILDWEINYFCDHFQ